MKKLKQAMHAEDSVNHCPIFETCKQWMVQNDYNEHNTRYFKFANHELGAFYEPLKAMFDDNLEDMTMSLFVQPPGQTMPSHVDTFFLLYEKNWRISRLLKAA